MVTPIAVGPRVARQSVTDCAERAFGSYGGTRRLAGAGSPPQPHRPALAYRFAERATPRIAGAIFTGREARTAQRVSGSARDNFALPCSRTVD